MYKNIHFVVFKAATFKNSHYTTYKTAEFYTVYLSMFIYPCWKSTAVWQ